MVLLLELSIHTFILYTYLLASWNYALVVLFVIYAAYFNVLEGILFQYKMSKAAENY